jgi:hypothetical protein
MGGEMSYQNRCSYCSAKGHNRVGCPERKERVEELREEGNVWSRLVQEDDRYKTRPKSTRKCSYCYNRRHEVETDHNRRNCPHLAEAKVEAFKLNKEWRKAALQVMKQKGLGAGAIFVDSSYGKCVITEVHWDNMSYKLGSLLDAEPYRCFTFVSLKSMAGGHDRQRSVGFPDGTELYTNWRAWSISDTDIIVPATERFIEASTPDRWKEGETGLENYFSAKGDKYF